MNSMTGFGRVEEKAGQTLTLIEIKSVNHRYLDFRFRLPPSLSFFEIPLAESLRKHFERGSFDIQLRQRLTPDIQTTSGNTRFILDESALQSLLNCQKTANSKFNTALTLSTENLLQTNRIFIPIEEIDDPNQTLKQVLPVFEKCLLELKKMRAREGEKIKELFLLAMDEIKKDILEIEVLAPLQAEKIKTRLTEKLSQWNLKAPIDAQRLEWEVALYADKSDITEELQRLHLHLKEFEQTLNQSKSIGRKLDFLTQELHREVNTIGSKASSTEITQNVIRVKTGIEKLREQVQNVE